MPVLLFRGVVLLCVLTAVLVAGTAVIFKDLYILLFLLLTLAQVFFGFYVLFQNYRNEINLSFAAFCFSLALWTLAVFMMHNARDAAELTFWGRTLYVGPVFIAYFFLYFTFVFPKKNVGYPRLNKLLLFAPTALVSAMVAGPWILEQAVFTAAGPSPRFGPGYLFFSVYFLSYFIYGLVILTLKYRQARGNEKIQIRYIFLGLFLAFLLGIVTNLVLPVFGQPQFLVWGPFFTLFLLGFATYAIVKHRLMSLEIVIQRSTVYAVATMLIMAFYALAVMVSETFFRRILGYSSLLITALAALIIAVAYQPLVKTFQGFTDRLFFRGRYDYQKILRQISQRIASVIKLEELTNLIVASFIDTMKVSEISFLLLDKDKEHFRAMPLSLPRYKKIEIDANSPIVSWLSAAKDILVWDEIEDEISRLAALGKEGEVRRGQLGEVREEMDRLSIQIWVPIISKNELIGIIALGNKLSGDTFTAEDIGLLGTLANQTAVALDNARLYSEVVTMKDYSEDILKSMTNAVITVNNKGRVVTFNQMAEKITGHKLAEVLGKTGEEIWGKRGTITRALINSLQDKNCVNFETHIASPERGIVPVAMSATLLRDAQGKKMGVLLTIRDMTEVRELEEKVRRADKLSALATMAAGMAHEIKNPLSSLKVFTQLLPLKFNDPEYRQKIGEIFPAEINRIDRIVESLLSFARSTALNFEPVEINKMLDEILKDYERQAAESEVKIIRQYQELPAIEVDNSQLSQVFSNLILNAIQVMPNGGALTISTRPGKRVEGMLEDIKVQVADTGYGLAPEIIKKLFDPFFTTKHGGTGLGLTIAHNIVDGHRGYIDVASEVGKGTVFTVTLPVSQSLL